MTYLLAKPHNLFGVYEMDLSIEPNLYLYQPKIV